jgi:hypothetical protein
MSDVRAVLWRRLEGPGHDACRVVRGGIGWTVEGTAVFLEAGAPARLSYRVVCDDAWRTVTGRVSGWVGRARVGVRVARGDGDRWRVNGAAAAALDGLIDVDLGFTPATNTLAIRRMGMGLGERAETVSAWLDPAGWTVRPLRQHYERLSEGVFAYRSPDHGFRARLETDSFGLVTEYPPLWTRAGGSPGV